MIFRLKTYDEIPSTNLAVKEALASGEPEGLVVIARSQTGGYGRQGRAWKSPEGGLYLSLLLRPSVPMETLSTLSLVLGLAVRRACIALIGDSCASNILLKWPNDLVVDASCAMEPSWAESPAETKACPGAPFLKLCGISLEAVAGGLCVGIGANVALPSEPVCTDGKYDPCYLADLGCSDVEALRDEILREVGTAYTLWIEKGFPAFLEEYRSCDALFGRRVSISDYAGVATCEGVAVGVDTCGRLLVRKDDGDETPVSSGEAHVCAC